LFNITYISPTFKNRKRCPNCSIMINRDDGCNKMECLHCGFAVSSFTLPLWCALLTIFWPLFVCLCWQFCWICEGPWSSLCGFYKCGQKEIEEAPTVVVEIVREPSTEVESSPEPPLAATSSSSNKRPRPQENAAVISSFLFLKLR